MLIVIGIVSAAYLINREPEVTEPEWYTQAICKLSKDQGKYLTCASDEE